MSKYIEKNAQDAGADERTPSKAEYFSWINNTNEGSTQAQTLINLEFFRYLRDTYNMQLDIYAWDAGNLDGASGTYETAESEKLKKQYPEGYKNVAAAAKELNTKLGVWCGPDGFGKTAESAKARYELMVSLCRDYHFGLFKMDSVCGNIRPSKTDLFIKMMKECRKYSPELILLNHRLRLGRAKPYATTFLLGGAETYVDVHICNETTAMHHRAFIFKREGVPGLKRLTEDHGVCISSCIDYFEDDLIIQAFGRCLILAPEIYANPWLMRDDETAHMAHIFNLHRAYRNILVDGKKLSEKTYGENAVSRGSADNRFIVTGNCTWEKKTITITLNEEIGLKKCDRVFVASHHPFEKVYGEFNYGEKVTVPIMPFRALLLQVCAADVKPYMPTGCEYEVLHEDITCKPDKIKLVSVNETALAPDGKVLHNGCFDETNRAPLFLGKAEKCEVPENSGEMLETAFFAVDADSLEARSLKRSGDTEIPQMKAARDAFFSQKTYILRGCESKFAFDGNKNTFFDTATKIAYGGMRVKGGCLRVDFGGVFDADTVEIEYFDPDKPDEKCISKQHVSQIGSYAERLSCWKASAKVTQKTLSHEKLPAVKEKVHNIELFDGRRRVASYKVADKLRYFSLDEPMDRIFGISLVKDGKCLPLISPVATNVMPPMSKSKVYTAQKLSFTLTADDVKNDCYIAVAINGKHGEEGVTAVAEINGVLYGCPDRAPSYQANAFECPARHSDSNYTYYLPVSPETAGKTVTVYVLHLDNRFPYNDTKVYLCDSNREITGKVIDL